MDVTVIGCGYVGLVTGTCLASIGHTVRGVEKDKAKLKTLMDGHCPIFEPGLQELMQENYASGQLQFTDDVKAAVKDAEIVFLCVGTPPKADGTVDMSYLEGAGKEVCDALCANNSDYMVTIIVKSTVPAGTNRKLYNFLKEQTKAHVHVVSNPEFLKEGTAVQDCLNPDRIVVGGESPEAFRMMRRLYDPLIKREENFLTMNWESAELTKYAANSMLAARISFMNEMTILCESYGADVEDIRKGIGSDSRIGPSFLRAGCGYGSCFPKDVAAMEHISKSVGYESLFVNAIQTINKNQKKRFAEKIVQKLGRPIEGATIAVWGLAFKADTDDIRESTAIDVINYLLDKGAVVRAHDYKGMENMKAIFKDRVEWSPDPVTAAAGADAVALVTDWPQYTTLPFRKIAATMNTPLIFDGRNCLNRDVMRENGFQYYPIGRPAVENALKLKNRV